MARPKASPRCEFCGEALADLMLAFVEHVEASPSCRLRYDEWRENVRREAGGT